MLHLLLPNQALHEGTFSNWDMSRLLGQGHTAHNEYRVDIDEVEDEESFCTVTYLWRAGLYQNRRGCMR